MMGSALRRTGNALLGAMILVSTLQAQAFQIEVGPALQSEPDQRAESGATIKVILNNAVPAYRYFRRPGLHHHRNETEPIKFAPSILCISHHLGVAWEFFPIAGLGIEASISAIPLLVPQHAFSRPPEGEGKEKPGEVQQPTP